MDDSAPVLCYCLLFTRRRLVAKEKRGAVHLKVHQMMMMLSSLARRTPFLNTSIELMSHSFAPHTPLRHWERLFNGKIIKRWRFANAIRLIVQIVSLYVRSKILSSIAYHGGINCHHSYLLHLIAGFSIVFQLVGEYLFDEACARLRFATDI